MTKSRPPIEYKVGARFCDTRAESTSHLHRARASRGRCGLLVRIRAFIECHALKLNCHNGAWAGVWRWFSRDLSGFCRFGFSARPLVTSAATSAAASCALRRVSRVVAGDVAWVQVGVGLGVCCRLWCSAMRHGLSLCGPGRGEFVVSPVHLTPRSRRPP